MMKVLAATVDTLLMCNFAWLAATANGSESHLQLPAIVSVWIVIFFFGGPIGLVMLIWAILDAIPESPKRDQEKGQAP